MRIIKSTFVMTMLTIAMTALFGRSEERRVGKECRY